jgi:Protein of unknown function (DUF1173)
VDGVAHDTAAPTAVYEIAGRRFSSDAPGFAQAIAEAHAAHHRPRCLCQPHGVEMYVARLGAGYIVKRMPDTGCQHAPECPSYEPPADCSGLGQVLGSAITEDPATGETALKLDFPLLKRPGHRAVPPESGESDSAATNGARLSLRGLLHYLWDQAGLTRWQPAFAGKRSWGTVRRHLLQAAGHMVAGGLALQPRLYIPEPFSVDRRDALNARRIAQWGPAVAVPGRPQTLKLLIGEVKEIVPARYGYKAVIKHLPDLAFGLDEALYRRLERRFEPELALWASADSVQMIMIATFSVSAAGVAGVIELSIMPVTAQWLPVESAFERQLVEHLVTDGRRFIKGLRYGLQRKHRLASATLTDTGAVPVPLFILNPGEDEPLAVDVRRGEMATQETPAWLWRPAFQGMPRLPPAAVQTAHRLSGCG